MKNLKGKLFILTFVIVFALAVFYTIQPEPEPTLAFTQMYNVNLQPGQTVEINLIISDVKDLSACITSLRWDPYILAVTLDPNGLQAPFTTNRYSIREGSFLKTASNNTRLTINSVNATAGEITNLSNQILEAGVTANGTGVLATINFTCINSGTTTIEIIGPEEGHAWVRDPSQTKILHKEIKGIITKAAPPPIWLESGFQTNVALVEIIGLIAVSIATTILIRPKVIRTREMEKEEEEIKI